MKVVLCISDGSWNLHINPWRLHVHGIHPGTAGKPIAGGGELVLGQSSRTADYQYAFNVEHAFLGEMGFVNIWRSVLPKEHILNLQYDCTFTECGDAVEWADFRAGTRGAMRVRWPSEIMCEYSLCPYVTIFYLM